MIRRIFRWTFFICGGLLAIAKVSFAAGEPLKLKIIYSSSLDMMADQFPQASGVDPQEVVDLTFVKQVEAGR